MEIKLSRELIWTLKTLQGKISIEDISDPYEYVNSHGIREYIPGKGYILISVDVSEYSKSFSDMIACDNWMNIIHTYFSTSYNSYRIDIGRLRKLFPVRIDFSTNIIFFRCDYVDKPSWKDWFIMEGDINASEFSIELLSHVRDP
jgi:hypothetical protein